LVAILAKSSPGNIREEAQRAVVLACSKEPDASRRAEPVLSVFKGADVATRVVLLPALGALGGPAALQAVWAAIQDPSPELQEAGVKALANWPDASAAPDLLKLSTEGRTREQRAEAVLGLARVAPRPGLSHDQAFNFLKTAFERADSSKARRYILTRMAPVRTPECLKFLLSCADKPELQVEAIASAAAIAEALKDSHPALARPALERVREETKNESLRDHVDTILTRMKWKGN
jgi:hypothetical protein